MTAIDQSINYGDAAPSYSYKMEGFVLGQLEPTATINGMPVLGCSYSQYDKANDYTITVDISNVSATNYTFKAVNGTLKVNKVALSVKAKDVNINYGDAVPAYDVEYTGFITGEDAGDLGGSLDYVCTYAEGSDAKDYTITPEGLTSDNYEISFLDGKLTVAPVALTVTAEDKTVTFLDAVPTYSREVQRICGRRYGSGSVRQSCIHLRLRFWKPDGYVSDHAQRLDFPATIPLRLIRAR